MTMGVEGDAAAQVLDNLRHVLPPSTWTTLGVDVLKGSVVTDAGDHLIVRSPQNPDYHWGHALYVTRGDPDEAHRWVAAFDGAFPTARHCAIALPARSRSPQWALLGLHEETVTSLTSSVAPTSADGSSGSATPLYRVGPFDDEDWMQRAAADAAENAASGGYPPAEYEAFVRAMRQADRELVRRGRAQWFGAHTPDGALAASLGVVLFGNVARYQAVLTAPEHRRQGLARHLVALAGAWALEQGARDLVIVADRDSDAEQLYARAGFVRSLHLGHAWYSEDRASRG